MLDFSNQTCRALLEAMLNRVSDTLDKREGSMIQTALGAGAYALEDFYLDLDKVQRGGAIPTAVGEDLDNWAAIANVERYPASPAVRLGVFEPETVPIGARFSTIDGGDSVNFTVTAQEGPGRYRLTCETPGEIGSRYTGPILPITVIPGLASARLTDILVPGDDTEADEALRARVISALRERPFGGNVADYKRVVRAIDGVGDLQVYPTWNGGGTVKLSILGADWMPASGQLVEAVQNAVDPPPNQGLGYGTAPIGATVTVTAPETVAVSLSAVLTLRAGYTVEQMQGPVEAALRAYLLSIRQDWAVPDADRLTSYTCWVYLARTISAILAVPGVVNATGVTLNGDMADLLLVETGEKQQVPVLGRWSYMPETDLCQYWPRWFREILDFQALCQTEGEELRLMAAFLERVRANLFVQTMDEGTAAVWEAILHITPNPVTEPLSFRRDRVLNRLSMHPPFTLTFLYQRLDALFGPGNWEVEVDYPNYTLYIEAAVEDQQYFAEMSVTMDLIKPCHIVYTSRPRVAGCLLLSEEVVKYHARYNYILGQWALGRQPFAEQGESEVVKMASQPSILQPLLDQAAGFVAEDIQSVRINGSIRITALSRSTVGNVASVGYRVLREQTEEVTRIELLDKAGTALTTSAVSVPVTEEAVAFRHAFVVKEGS